MPPKAACKKCAPLVEEKEAELGQIRRQLSGKDVEIAAFETEKARLKDELEKLRTAKDQEVAALKAEHAKALADQAAAGQDALAAELANARSQLVEQTVLAQDLRSRLDAALAFAEEARSASKQGLEAEKRAGEALKAQLAERDARLATLDAKVAAAERSRRAQENWDTAIDGVRPEARRAVGLRNPPVAAAPGVTSEEVETLRNDLTQARGEAARLRAELAKRGRDPTARTQLICAKRALDGALLAQLDVLNPSVAADMQLARLKREGEAIAERSWRAAARWNETLRSNAVSGEEPFLDSLSREMARFELSASV
eukprot:TRINITY_DN12002_c0_g1_i1.p1 TRINITY_DN12002_c0_g1~~TRINITY_DN12002_c0_g1_i1.p1  ORF type:complete len:315 (+),score=98.98 TRINITY_DN12002_c0_g1_i1:256-1200(+)